MLLALLERYAFPLGITIALHVVIALAMLRQWSPDTLKNEIKRPNYVQAKLVKLDDVSKQSKISPSKTKIVDLTKRREEQERRKKLAEQKRKQEVEKKRVADAKKQAEAEKKKKELEQQERKKAERQRQERQAQQEQQAFEQALAEEQQELMEQSYAVEAQSFMSVISQRIEQNWSRPPSARNGMECELLIKLVPTGRVINVDITKSSGNELFDRSAVQAVNKAEQFPELKTMKSAVFERYYRELKLIFRPQDLRQ